MRRLWLRLIAWRAWRHVLWLSGIGLLAIALWIVRSQTPPLIPAVQQYVAPANPRPTIDATILAIMESARQESIELGQRRITSLISILAQRVETQFLPRYLSFGRRKMEELHAYNTFAWQQVQKFLGKDTKHDSAKPLLMENFEQDFSSLVLTPMETQEVLRTVGREVARHYATLVAAGLQRLQETRGIPFSQWQRYLDSIPPGQVQVDGHPILSLPIAALAVPDPMRDRLGAAIGNALETRFNTFSRVTDDSEGLRMPDGRSIFDIGSDAWTYYGSYILYWIALVLLLRSGLIPVNLFAFLLGWLAWETFVWGSWIAFESFNFEQTKAQLEPIILHQTDTYFNGLRSALTDSGSGGPFQILWSVEQAWLRAADTEHQAGGLL